MANNDQFDTTKFGLNFQLRTIKEWRDLLKKPNRVSWMQTLHYAVAAKEVDHRKTHFATIEKNSEIIGVVSIQELNLGPIQFVSIYRGPLWFEGEDTSANMQAFTSALEKVYPNKFLRRFRWMPEWSFGEKHLDFLDSKKFSKTNQSFETLWVDIRPTLQQLRTNLHQKWRNALNKAERSDLQVVADFQGHNLDLFLKEYEFFKAHRKFKGPSARFFKKEIESAIPFKDALILWAKIAGVPVAGIIVLRHGRSASYRVGWNSIEGRKSNAHYLLLWRAIEILKQIDIENFDLGGVYPDDKDGLTHFKSGLSGEHFKTEILK